MSSAQVAVIGGTGFYEMDGLKDVEEVSISTPFGDPSDKVVLGSLGDRRMAFLARHGRGHRLAPAEVNVRANIFALKSLGVKWILSISAVGSLQEDIHPRDFVIPDQLIDHTRHRTNSFFGQGAVAHVGLAHPFCESLRQLLIGGAESTGLTVHRSGIYLCMEGPQFSTMAESNIYRTWKCAVIGMTVAPEAKLAREAEICYSAIACSTDYDCWHEEHASVTVDMIIENLHANVNQAQQVVRHVVPKISLESPCKCHTALANALITDRGAVPSAAVERLKPILGRYFEE